jgi:hypothetical protein
VGVWIHKLIHSIDNLRFNLLIYMCKALNNIITKNNMKRPTQEAPTRPQKKREKTCMGATSSANQKVVRHESDAKAERKPRVHAKIVNKASIRHPRPSASVHGI